MTKYLKPSASIVVRYWHCRSRCSALRRRSGVTKAVVEDRQAARSQGRADALGGQAATASDQLRRTAARRRAAPDGPRRASNAGVVAHRCGTDVVTVELHAARREPRQLRRRGRARWRRTSSDEASSPDPQRRRPMSARNFETTFDDVERARPPGRQSARVGLGVGRPRVAAGAHGRRPSRGRHSTLC